MSDDVGTEQVFLESGVWKKPPGATWIRVDLAGGTGGDANPGGTGNPGEQRTEIYAASELPDEMNVTIGQGGRDPARRASGHGWARVATYFGSQRPAAGEPGDA